MIFEVQFSKNFSNFIKKFFLNWILVSVTTYVIINVSNQEPSVSTYEAAEKMNLL